MSNFGRWSILGIPPLTVHHNCGYMVCVEGETMWNDAAVQELLLLMRAILGALGNIGDQVERLVVATEKKGPPSSKRGGK